MSKLLCPNQWSKIQSYQIARKIWAILLALRVAIRNQVFQRGGEAFRTAQICSSSRNLRWRGEGEEGAFAEINEGALGEGALVRCALSLRRTEGVGAIEKSNGTVCTPGWSNRGPNLCWLTALEWDQRSDSDVEEFSRWVEELKKASTLWGNRPCWDHCLLCSTKPTQGFSLNIEAFLSAPPPLHVHSFSVRNGTQVMCLTRSSSLCGPVSVTFRGSPAPSRKQFPSNGKKRRRGGEG